MSFVAAMQIPTGGEDDDYTEAVIGDFNGDGKKDVAKIVYVDGYEISVVLGNGDGTFQAATLTGTPGGADDPIIVGDVNGDGKDDIIMVHPAEAATIDVLISNGDGTFAAPVNYFVTDVSLQGGLLTDIDGDGKLDLLAFDNDNPADVIELLGNGDGTFQDATTLAALTGSAPNAMFFGDFNGDGKLDFAGYSGNRIEVSLGSGTGNFAAPVLLTTADGQYNSCFATAGDLTGDGKPEMVAVNCELDTVTVYVNKGDGTFQNGVYYDSNFNSNNFPLEATIADVNGDGNNDIVMGNDDSGNISILLGHGDGTVTAEALSYDTGGFPWTAPLVADFNGDGLMDVLIPDDYYNLIYLQGYGDGSFRAAPSYEAPNSFAQDMASYSVATGDFNGDGIPDVVIGQDSNYGAAGVVVYIAKGDGTFYPGMSYGTGVSLAFVAVADFNGDGKLDIAATDYANGVVQIFMGDGDGTFSVGPSYPTDSGTPLPQNVVTGDFNHDGKMDLAIANANSQTVGVWLGNGDGTFGSFASYPVTNYSPNTIAVGDVNGDGYLDLAVTATTDGPSAVGILLANNDNTGTFQPITYTNVNGYPNYVTFGDLDNDGKADFAVTLYEGTYPGTIDIALGNGDGTFQTPVDYPSSTFNANPEPADIQMIDLDGDGNLDLVYLNSYLGSVAVMFGAGDGTVSTPFEFPTTEYAWGMALADVDNDGSVDVLAGNGESGGVSMVLNGSGSGTAPNYSLGTTTPSGTVTAGGSATYTLNLSGRNGYNGTISFACSNLPKGTTCTFSPSSVVASGNLPLSTTVTITTTARAAASLMRPARPGSQPGSQPGSPILLATFGGMGMVGLLLAGKWPEGPATPGKYCAWSRCTDDSGHVGWVQQLIHHNNNAATVHRHASRCLRGNGDFHRNRHRSTHTQP